MRNFTYWVTVLTVAAVAPGFVPGAIHAEKLGLPMPVRRDTLEHYVEDLVKLLGSDDVFERQDGSDGLCDLGPKAKAAVPSLVELLKGKHQDKKRRACWVVESIGPDAKAAVPWLVKMLGEPKNGEEDLRSWAVSALGAVGPDAKEAVLALTNIMDDKKSPRRAQAAVAVFRITKDQAKVEPVLLEVLKTSGPPGTYGRYLAANFFRRHPSKSKEALNILVDIVANPAEDPDVVVESAYALWLTWKHEKAIPTLIHLLKTGKSTFDPEYFLSEIGPPAKAAIPVLITKIKESCETLPKLDHLSVQAELSLLCFRIDCLGKFGPDAKEGVETLRTMLKHFNLGIQSRAAVALWRINKSMEALQHLRQAALKGTPKARLHAIGLLHDLGQLSKADGELLADFLHHEDFEVRARAEELFKKIHPVPAK